MHHYIKLFFLSLTISFTACEKDADVKLPAVESKLVISSFISPEDTIIKVVITISQPLYNNSNSNQYSTVNNATVQISNGTNVQTLAYNSDENYYFVSASIFPITEGITYNLTVSTPDGKNVNASTTIPSVNTTLVASSTHIEDPNFSNKYFIKAKWNDPSEIENFYRLVYSEKSYSFGSTDTTYYQLYSNNYSDEGRNGTLINESFEIFSTYVNPQPGSTELKLINASKEYYLYHSKLELAAFSGGPFSEPVQMYTNINGGFGVFAGYNTYKITVAL